MPDLTTWGVEASPFLLKLEAMLRFHALPFRRLPAEGGRLENWQIARRLSHAKRNHLVLRYPEMDQALDEYPSVPFLCENGRVFHYDTSSLGHWLDHRAMEGRPRLYPGDPTLRFIAHLVDEAFDEFGLYLVHHMRWVGSATDTTMGERAAQELSRVMTPFLAPGIRKHLPRRQVRRCPYLFSVAPQGYTADVEPERVPPSRDGFPQTHDLLLESWLACLDAMESLLGVQPWILGNRFSAADASVYGQLSMNLIDPSAARILRERAPRTFRWLEDIRDGKHVGSGGSLYLSAAAHPLLEMIMVTFAPLMVQNERAWAEAKADGETMFNEAAFDQGRALYDGHLLGHPFRAVVKTFQVRVWAALRERWRELSEPERCGLREVLPDNKYFEIDPHSV